MASAIFWLSPESVLLINAQMFSASSCEKSMLEISIVDIYNIEKHILKLIMNNTFVWAWLGSPCGT